MLSLFLIYLVLNGHELSSTRPVDSPKRIENPDRVAVDETADSMTRGTGCTPSSDRLAFWLANESDASLTRSIRRRTNPPTKAWNTRINGIARSLFEFYEKHGVDDAAVLVESVTPLAVTTASISDANTTEIGTVPNIVFVR